MKKFFMYIICFCLILNMPMLANAQEASRKVGNGYTTDGVYYEVFIADDMENDGICLHNTSITVTREVRFSGEVTTPKQLSLTEKIEGVYYSGTLKLKKYSYVAGVTVATYTGMLYAG